MVKKDLNVLLVRKMIKRLNFHTYFSQKWHHIEMTLMKLNIYFFNKRWWIIRKYNEIWENVNDSLQKEFDSKPIYNEKYLKAKRKSYNGKINTNFHNNKIPKEGPEYICLLVILLDSIFRTGKNYPQVLLEEMQIC